MAEKKKTKIDDIAKKLEDGIANMLNSDNYRNYLSTMSKFYNYSINNIILIAFQNPNATLVAGYNAWKDKFKRTVKKGEKAISIMAPVKHKKQVQETDANGNRLFNDDGTPKLKTVTWTSFRSVPVFDVSQTEGKPLPTIGINEIEKKVKDYNKVLDMLINISDIPVSFENIDGGAKGYFSIETNRIVVKEAMSEAQTIKTLLHEMTHAALHGKGCIAENADRQTKEVEAESVAFVVADYLGIDTSEYSFGYITGWSEGKDIKILKDSLELIKLQSSKFISEISKHTECEVAV